MPRVNPSLYPLRKIVDFKDLDEILECGHSLLRASDMYGPRFPNKRRCRHCWAALPQEEKDRLIKEAAHRRMKRSDAAHKALMNWARERD